jgi:hypothetical protein
MCGFVSHKHLSNQKLWLLRLEVMPDGAGVARGVEKVPILVT